MGRVVRHEDVLEDRQVREHARELEGSNDPGSGHLVRGHPHKVSSVESNGPPAGANIARKHAEHGRLARAVRADDAGDGPLSDREADLVDRANPAEVPAETLCLEQRFRPSLPGRRWAKAVGLIPLPDAWVETHGLPPRLSEVPAAVTTARRRVARSIDCIVRRRSGSSPCGRTQRKVIVTIPVMIHSSEASTVGLLTIGMYSTACCRPTGMSSAPRATPNTLARPPTMIPVNSTKVSGYNHPLGAHAPTNSTRIPPLRAATSPPITNTSSRLPLTFRPTAPPARSFSRMARNLRPRGDSTIRCISQPTKTQTTPLKTTKNHP